MSKQNSYYKQSEKAFLSISLKELKLNSASYVNEDLSKYYQVFARLVTFSPTSQSHLGNKFDSYSKIKDKTKNDFLVHLFSELKIRNVYVFKSYSTSKNEKKDLKSKVQTNNTEMLIYNTSQGVVESLYAGIRNAIAHGNIIKDSKFYYLYSVCDEKYEFDSNLKFLLKIRKLDRLEILLNILDEYR